jgi:hypothetical protein
MKNEQKIEFLKSVIQRIAAYQSPEELQAKSEEDWGLEYAEALEMAYENILLEANEALQKVENV